MFKAQDAPTVVAELHRYEQRTEAAQLRRTTVARCCSVVAHSLAALRHRDCR